MISARPTPPLKDDELASAREKTGVNVIQLPMTAGAVSVCYNVPGLDPETPLKLSRDMLLKFLLQEEFDDPTRLIYEAADSEDDRQWKKEAVRQGE